jgi:sterol desaturase/sphingolipid hydroxylase (fatty acid hydroxylase superfamily)
MEWLAHFINIKSAVLATIVLVPLQLAFPMHSQQKILRPEWRTDLVYLLLNGIPIKFGLVGIFVLTLPAIEHVIPTELRTLVASQALWLQFIELIVVADLGFYVVHRLFHKVPRLWRFHAVHHSIKELDWLAAHRVHPFDQVLTKGASLILVFALGFSEWAIAAGAIMYQWHSLLLHSNVRLRLGPLRWLVASPEFHHWHHSNHREAWNTNFGAQLPLWDLLFGTAYMPKGRVPCRYGIDDPVPQSYLEQLLYPFRNRP